MWAIGFFIFAFITLALLYNEWQNEKEAKLEALKKIDDLEKQVRVLEEVASITKEEGGMEF
jgi:hypothetical protein|nr:MAG TPA: cell division protein [Caudoviricetes sp.]